MTPKFRYWQVLINESNFCKLHEPVLNTLRARAFMNFCPPGGGVGGGSTTPKIELGLNKININIICEFQLST